MAQLRRSLHDEFVILVVDNNQPQEEDESSSPCKVISISASEISSWDLSYILCYRRVKIRAHRTRHVLCSYTFTSKISVCVVKSCSDPWFMSLYARLIQESSYFHGLLSGSFRLESSLCSVCYVIVCSSCCVTWIL